VAVGGGGAEAEQRQAGEEARRAAVLLGQAELDQGGQDAVDGRRAEPGVGGDVDQAQAVAMALGQRVQDGGRALEALDGGLGPGGERRRFAVTVPHTEMPFRTSE
jgi:hypothetical protein